MVYYAMPHGNNRKVAKAGSRRALARGPRGRVWIDGPRGTYLGYGRVVLLERIMEHGSITRAAKSMEMSYRHAWELVESMNMQSRTPLVATATGGRRGGGAVVTPEGERAVKAFWRLHADFQRFLEKQSIKLSREGLQ